MVNLIVRFTIDLPVANMGEIDFPADFQRCSHHLVFFEANLRAEAEQLEGLDLTEVDRRPKHFGFCENRLPKIDPIVSYSKSHHFPYEKAMFGLYYVIQLYYTP